MKLLEPVDLPPASAKGGPRKAVMVPAGAVPHLMQFARIVLPPGQEAAAHCHADWTEVYLVERGEAVMTVDGVPVRLSPGKCLCVEPGELHELRNDGTADFEMVFFSIQA